MISLGRTTDRVRLVDKHIAVLRNTLLLKTRRIAEYNQHWVEILMAATAMKQELEFRLPWPAREFYEWVKRRQILARFGEMQ